MRRDYSLPVMTEMHSQDDQRLRHDHAEIGKLLSQLIATIESNDVTRIYETLDLFWARLAVHIRAEHLHLFEAVLRAVNRNASTSRNDAPTRTEAQRTIEELHDDHDFFMRELSQTVAVVRGILANPKADAAKELRYVLERIDAVQERLIKHNEKEEKGIYDWVNSLLSEAERTDLAVLVNKELKNMPPRFGGKTGEA